ncbi:stealth conserved region 3 domain-containing protein [Actinomadura barringtoniae]|uniref:Stealth conserved region 3 domain-containing protein n=1 Tax=Actinomadura barringtoniae TaxID=1427535 RepID=A0A939PLF1_9ACTN|nr:stealth family protein [Actinomadura barringtoniae]MBO2454770.1 stealth conserved region 3 domain-containing protein [Actinomadura barringtoniae]
MLRIYRPLVSGSKTLKLSADCACDLEFWDESPSGSLVAPRPTLIGDTVPANALEPAELVIGDRAHPSLAAFTKPLVDDLAFPIDAVYTWVDGGDPAWRARRDQTLTALGLTPSRADGGDSRYASRDELRYSLRSLAMFAPWIRHVWIVTDGQRPEWLRDAPGVTVVDHRDIFTDQAATALPTFNSHAIETQLHHIDGLAEHFLYFNDDFFLGRPVRPDAFFHANGISQFFPSPTAIPPGPRTDRDPTWIAAGKNNRALIEREFGRSTASALKHAPYALRRSVLAEMEERFADEIERTAHSRIRSVNDVALVSSLYHYYAFSTARAVPAEVAVDTVPLSHSSGQATLDRLLAKRDRDCFCLNDMASGDLSEADKYRVAMAFMEAYLPIPGPFETSDAGDTDEAGEAGEAGAELIGTVRSAT